MVSVVAGTVPRMAGIMGWNPWRALRARERTVLLFERLHRAHAVSIVADGDELIVLDPGLTRTERRAALTHELVHLERGILPAGAPRSVVDREEHQVRGETAARLVPLDALAAFVVARCGVEPVTIEMVAEEFDVPNEVAERAMARLRHPRSADLRRRHGIEEAA